MKSITIHNLDDKLETLILEKARKSGLSLNKTIKMLLNISLGLGLKSEENYKNDFLDLFGIWSKKDEEEFTNNTKGFNKINRRDWR